MSTVNKYMLRTGLKPRFKDRNLQTHYELCRRLAADRTSEFWHDGRPRRGAGHRAAYWNGRSGMRSSWPYNTFAHASWAAGRDDRKQFGPVEGSEKIHWLGL